MKKFLLTLMALVAVAGLASAQGVTLSVTDATDIQGTHNEEKPASGSNNGEAENWKPLESFKIGDYTFTFSGSADGKQQPAYYKVMTGKTGPSTVRLYANCSMTVTAPAGVEMSSISFKGSNAASGLNVTASTGTFTLSGNNGTWAGKSNTLTITVSATWRISELTVLTDGENPGPAPEPDGVTFESVTKFAAGKYVLVADNSSCAAPLAASKTYGYLPVVSVSPADGKVVTPEENAFEFEAVDGGYAIKQSDGRYLYMKGAYNSFNLTDDLGETEGGHVFSVTAGENGTWVITNVMMNKTLQYSTQYKSYGAYPDVQGVYPAVYKLVTSAVETVEVNNDAPVQYYTIQGKQVNGDNLAAGLYIRRQGNVATKIIVK